MPVPDHVIFGPSQEGRYTYGQVRELAEAEQFEAIRSRVGAFFNSQVSELSVQGDGKKKVYSPFPLFLLGCVGIETLGRLFFGRKPEDDENRQEIQKQGFIKACSKLHQKFGRPLSSDQKEDFDKLWGENAHDEITSISFIVYKLGRHTMVHGYQARGVYLTEDIEDFEITEGSLVLNPYGFWCLYLRAFDKLWNDFTNKNTDHPQKESMRIYRDILIK